jgi:ketosteroid isomerase-like protein
MSQENVAVVRSAYDAFRRGNVQMIFHLLHTEIEIYQSEGVPWGGIYKGHQEIASFFKKLTETIESRVEPDHLIDDDAGHVVVVGHTRGRVRGTGREFDLPTVHVWTIREGKVVKFEAYIDTAEMRVALGLVSYLTNG